MDSCLPLMAFGNGGSENEQWKMEESGKALPSLNLLAWQNPAKAQGGCCSRLGPLETGKGSQAARVRGRLASSLLAYYIQWDFVCLFVLLPLHTTSLPQCLVPNGENDQSLLCLWNIWLAATGIERLCWARKPVD